MAPCLTGPATVASTSSRRWSTATRPSTKAAVAALAAITERPRTLVVLERGDDVTWLSLRNLDLVHVLTADQLNTYDVLLSDDVIFTKAAYDAFVAGPAKGKSAKAVATSTEAEAVVVEKPADEKPAKKPAKKAAAEAGRGRRCREGHG